MSTRWVRALFCLLFCLMAATAVTACKDDKSGEGEAEAAEAKPVAWNDGDLEAGKSYTHKLKFWMTGSHADGNAIVPNLHFDAAEHERVVFAFDPSLAEQAEGLEQNKIYDVTFTYEPKADNPTQKGTVTKIE